MAALKRRALERIFKTQPPGRECLDWIAREGDLLRLYATYCALDDFLHSRNPDLWIWPDWPEEYRDPLGSAGNRQHLPAGMLRAKSCFHGWLQWLVDAPNRGGSEALRSMPA